MARAATVPTLRPVPSDNRGRRPQRWPTRARGVLNALNLSTLLGLGVATLGGASLRRGPDGLWLGEGYRLALPKAGAFTIGNVVTTASTFTDLLTHQPDVLDHESRHAWQYAVTGLAFFPQDAIIQGFAGKPPSANTS